LWIVIRNGLPEPHVWLDEPPKEAFKNESDGWKEQREQG
jgi:hypothetical protein